MNPTDKNHQIAQLVIFIGEQNNRIEDLINYHHKAENSDEVQTCRGLIAEAQQKIWDIRWNKVS